MGVDSYTKLLVHFNGTDGQTTYTTEDAGARTVTFAGTAQLDTAQKEFGSAALLLDGDSDFVSIPDSDDWNFGSDDFTIDFWMRPSAWSASDFYMFWSQFDDGDNYVQFYKVSSPQVLKLAVYSGAVDKAQYTTTSAPTINTNTWYHVALVRSNSTLIDGKKIGIAIDGTFLGLTETTAIGSNSLPNLTASPCISANKISGATYFFPGWIDEYRVSKGIARWTTNFTPPTKEYGSFSGGLQCYIL